MSSAFELGRALNSPVRTGIAGASPSGFRWSRMGWLLPIPAPAQGGLTALLSPAQSWKDAVPGVPGMMPALCHGSGAAGGRLSSSAPSPAPGHRSSSSSICTEDFAARFREGMVEPLLFSEEEEDEPAGDVPTEGDDPGRDESLFPAGRGLRVQRPSAVEPGRCPLQSRSPPLMRRESLESLGGRISRLSQSGALGTAPGCPRPAPSTQLAQGREDSPHRGSYSRKDPLTTAVRSEERAAGRPWGISAGRSRAGARRGSPQGGLPGDSSAGSRGHPTSKPLGPRWQKPPALQGWRGAVVTLAVDDEQKEGAGSRQRGAPCPVHRESAPAPGCWGSAGGGWRDWERVGEGAWQGQGPPLWAGPASCVQGTVAETGPSCSGGLLGVCEIPPENAILSHRFRQSSGTPWAMRNRGRQVILPRRNG